MKRPKGAVFCVQKGIPRMAEPGTESAATPSQPPVTIELGPDPSIYGDLVPAAQPDATEPITSDAESSAPATTEAVDLPTPPADVEAADDDTPSTDPSESTETRRERTRRLRAEEEESIRSEERAAVEAKYQEDLAASRGEVERRDAIVAHHTRLRALSERWNPPAEHTTALDRAVKAGDWNTMSQYQWTDEKGIERSGFLDREEALDYLHRVEEDRDVRADMYGAAEQTFVTNTETHFNELAKSVGIDPKEVTGQTDFRVGLTNLIEAAKRSARGELQEQLDAALAENKVLRAKNGPSSSPELGGSPSGSGVWTFAKYEAAMASGEADKWTPTQRDNVLAQCRENKRRVAA